jgi:hypothetical protein
MDFAKRKIPGVLPLRRDHPWLSFVVALRLLSSFGFRLSAMTALTVQRRWPAVKDIRERVYSEPNQSNASSIPSGWISQNEKYQGFSRYGGITPG